VGQLHKPAPVLLIIAASSRHDAAMSWFRDRVVSRHGPIALTSEAFAFTETDYYTSTMGAGLQKQFVALQRLIDAGALAPIKCETNLWEAEYAALKLHAESRPLNLDPGYITPAKLVLASTKDHAHRIYLGDGIYAEVTLTYRARQWRAMEWTYPDYRRADYQRFFTHCREWLNCEAARDAIE
jgi:hypothetical protein